jgi:hypothetical protein
MTVEEEGLTKTVEERRFSAAYSGRKRNELQPLSALGCRAPHFSPLLREVGISKAFTLYPASFSIAATAS